jgi:hypothetical protein
LSSLPAFTSLRVMGAQGHWPPVVRIAWSTCGVVAVNEPGPEPIKIGPNDLRGPVQVT